MITPWLHKASILQWHPKNVDTTEAGPMMIINTTRILGYTAMAFAAAALGTQQLAAYQARQWFWCQIGILTPFRDFFLWMNRTTSWKIDHVTLQVDDSWKCDLFLGHLCAWLMNNWLWTLPEAKIRGGSFTREKFTINGTPYCKTMQQNGIGSKV